MMILYITSFRVGRVRLAATGVRGIISCGGGPPHIFRIIFSASKFALANICSHDDSASCLLAPLAIVIPTAMAMAVALGCGFSYTMQAS